MPTTSRAALRLTASCALVVLALLAPARAAEATGPRASAAQAQDAVDVARAAYVAAGAKVAALSAQADRLDASADAAESEAERLRAAVSDDDGGLLSTLGGLVGRGPSDLDRAAEAAADARAARDLADLVDRALADQIAATEQARLDWQRAERRQEQVAARWSAAQAADAAIERSQFRPSYDVADRAQDRRNQRALSAWHDYLRELADAGVVPPTAAELADPAHLPDGLEPLHDALNEPSPGVAVLDRHGRPAVTVLPAETVRAVSEAFGRIGLPQVPGDVEPTAYACGGLVANAWASATDALPADAAGQWTGLRAVPTRSVQIGDVVVLGSKRTGLAQTGVYLGRDQLVVVDPTTGVAEVRPMTMPVLGVRRVGPPAQSRPPTPAGGPCGTTDEEAVDANGPLVLPVASGSYTLSAGFGDTGGRWATGTHTGQDFAAPVGTPVVAAAGGTVTVEHPSWAGNLVRIDHGGGVETWYAHLSRVDVATGDRVAAGDPVGAVGDRGNTTGPHLHFEVRLDGLPYEPAQVLTIPDRPAPSYVNGELPPTALCPATPDGVQQLRCDAAVAYRLMSAGFADTFGAELCITDSYRSRAGQERVFVAKPGLAAVPGTSVHGLGRAVDLCGGVERFGTAEHDWVVEHGPSYGWHHPDWAAAGGSRPEPWHFEYAGTR